MSDVHETLLLRKEELEDIAYREQLEKEEYIKNNPYYWLVKAYRINVDVYFHWEEWSDSLSELLENIRCAHKDQLKVRIERFKRTLED